MMISPPITAVPVIAPIPVAVSAPVKSNPSRQPGERQHDKNHDRQEADSAVDSAEQKTRVDSEDQTKTEELKQRDQEVRAHEASHKGAAGQYAHGAARFTYVEGPDGQQYAVAGEVSIDTSKPDDPREALHKSAVLMRAALAPLQPSAQDRRVAAAANQMANEARQQIQSESANQTGPTPPNNTNQAISAAYDIAQQSSSQFIDVLV